MGEHTERSTLAACVASILGVPASEVPLAEDGLRAWLSARGLGLAAVQSAEEFAWAGPWIAWRPRADGQGPRRLPLDGLDVRVPRGGVVGVGGVGGDLGARSRDLELADDVDGHRFRGP